MRQGSQAHTQPQVHKHGSQAHATSEAHQIRVVACQLLRRRSNTQAAFLLPLLLLLLLGQGLALNFENFFTTLPIRTVFLQSEEKVSDIQLSV